ncbi:MAG: hypothetical protein HY321_03460 [Armatimonadetes bacterium]|nr:hypothetical protein [Armatimonadota bacterium]
MGTYHSVAAVRECSPDDVEKAVCAYAAQHHVDCESIEVKEPPEPEEERPPRWPIFSRLLSKLKQEEKAPEAVGQGRSDVVIFAPVNGWTVLFWPPLFQRHDLPAARWLSRQLDATVSAVHTCEGDYWVHVLFDKGKEVDRFASRTDLAAPTPGAATRLMRKWRGDAAAVAGILGVDPRVVSRYYAHIGPEGPNTRLPGDQFSLDDPWVFTDFWRSVGILYPEDTLRFERQLGLSVDFPDKLPAATGTDDL